MVPDSSTGEPRLTAELVSWEEQETFTDPYTGAGGVRPSGTQIKAMMRVAGESVPVTVWYTPHKDGWDYYKYVVRADTDAGRKSKDVFDSPDGLYLKNRGVPWHTDKQWTYLSKEICERRAAIAQLGAVVPDPDIDQSTRYRILLDATEQPLVTNDTVAETLVSKLTRGLFVLQSESNPAV